MLFIGKNKIIEIYNKDIVIHHVCGSDMYYIRDLLNNHKSQNNELTFKIFLDIACDISFLDYSKDKHFKINKLIEKRIPIHKETTISKAISINNAYDLGKDKVELSTDTFGPIVHYMKEYKPNLHSKYSKRFFPSLGGICSIRTLVINKNRLVLVCYFHNYQWRYKSNWAYCEALIDLGHASSFLKSIGYKTSVLKLTPFYCFFNLEFHPKDNIDWRILQRNKI